MPSDPTDMIGIGTSPLMLLLALREVQRGAKVTLIDRAEAPGGAWRSIDLFGHLGVEPAVHLLENRPGIAQYLQAASGVEMIADPDTPDFGLWRGRKIGFGATRVALHSLVGAKALLGGKVEQARRMGVSARRALANLKTPFVYPAHGMGDVVQALAQRFTEAGGTLRLGQEVTGVALDGAGATIRLAQGEIGAACVMFTSRAHAPLSGSPVAARTGVIRNVVLHFDGEWAAPTGYVEVFGDKTIKRLRNTGALARRAPGASGALASVQLRPEAGIPAHDLARDLTGDLAEVTLAHLQRLGVIRPGANALGARLFLAPSDTAQSAPLAKIAARNPARFRFVESTDFAEALVKLV
jgi:hypothetical protein